MEATILGAQIVPDQVQVVNPALVLLLIPFFDRIFYPYLTKHNILENPLYRMAIGGLIAGMAFLSAGILELILEKNYPYVPAKEEATINFINTLPCSLELYNPFNAIQIINSTELFSYRNIFSLNYTKYKVNIHVPDHCGQYHFRQSSISRTIFAAERQVFID